jgi:hypothetical protein
VVAEQVKLIPDMNGKAAPHCRKAAARICARHATSVRSVRQRNRVDFLGKRGEALVIELSSEPVPALFG